MADYEVGGRVRFTGFQGDGETPMPMPRDVEIPVGTLGTVSYVSPSPSHVTLVADVYWDGFWAVGACPMESSEIVPVQGRRLPLPMSADEAVAALDGLAGDDGDELHHHADEILLASAPPEVRDAYGRVVDRADFWATA